MLLIEKAIKLMDDYHFREFRNYVKNISIRSYYPLALVDVIKRDLLIEQDSDKLCEMVYSEADEKTKKKFFQLAHYTFKLTAYLSKNYPSYLYTNVNLIQRYINQGKVKEAEVLAEYLLDISTKLEDFNTQIVVLELVAQKEALQESIKDTVKIHEQIATLQEYQRQINEIYLHWRKNFSAKGKAQVSSTTEALLNFFKPFFKSKSIKISLLSRYYFQQGLYYLKDKNFYTSKNYQELLNIEKELNNNDYIVFPFLVDLNYRITYLKLRHLLQSMDMDSIMEQTATILNISDDVLFWKNFVNLPELFSFAIQASYYASKYMTPYKEDHIESLPDEVKKQLDRLKARCKEQIETNKWEEQFTIKFINLQTIYSGLLLLGDKKEIKESISVLEGILFNYQQLPFHTFIDPIFINLIIGYFSLGQYDDVETSYRRYKKMTNNKVVNPENDLTLHGFYYASKWLETERKQYVKKINKVYQDMSVPSMKDNREILKNLMEYYKIPID